MKLLNRTTSVYLSSTIPVLIVTLVLFYFLVRYFNLNHVEKNLIEEHADIVRKSKSIKNYFVEDELSDEIFVEEIPLDSVVVDNFSTVSVYDSLEDTYKPHRQLETMQLIAGKNYRIVVSKSLVENSTLIYSISIAVVVLILFMSGVFVILSRVLSTRIWTPFHSILSSLIHFKIGENYPGQARLSIDEFRDLDKAIQSMTKRINKEFFIQKEFIDIMSHEYQTPLAVIGNKAELLLQNSNMEEADLNHINDIIEYVGKLSKLNKGLLLLSRIDNNQFQEVELVSLKDLTDQILEERRTQIDYRKIDARIAYKGTLTVAMNKTLAGLLIGNLIQNAIRHNHAKGHINIEIRLGKYHVYNTGKNLELDRASLYQKFSNKSNSKNSLGLGLSLIKSICDYNGFDLNYEYLRKTEEHHFWFKFMEERGLPHGDEDSPKSQID